MRGLSWRELGAVIGLILACLPARAQESQLLPEVDFYAKLNSEIRFQIQMKQTREGGEQTQAEIGPTIDFYVHPWIRLAKVREFDLDDAKSRPLVLAMGYRYLPEANGGAATNRLEPVWTSRFPVGAKVLVTDRNRLDLDWKTRGFTWRYRNRLQLEGPIRVGSYHVNLYAAVEPFYQSQYGKWSETAIYTGGIFPIGKHVQLDTYYEHQNQTGKRPNEQLNQFGLMLELYF
ncbi:MAG TPA: DUF2490 domain-containing protein [Edaphobacter sp.]|jgi:hypothetical protein|nr:DUF2490 domain-containing protein [Edaphobacter sp.]